MVDFFSPDESGGGQDVLVNAATTRKSKGSGSAAAKEEKSTTTSAEAQLTASTTKGAVPDKRMNHILSEQRRRNIIKQGFQRLHDIIPEFAAVNNAASNGGTAGISSSHDPAEGGVGSDHTQPTLTTSTSRRRTSRANSIIASTSADGNDAAVAVVAAAVPGRSARIGAGGFSKSDILFKAAEYIARLQQEIHILSTYVDNV